MYSDNTNKIECSFEHTGNPSGDSSCLVQYAELPTVTLDPDSRAIQKPHIKMGQIWRDNHPKRKHRWLMIQDADGEKIECHCLHDNKVRKVRREQFNRGRTGYSLEIEAVKGVRKGPKGLEIIINQ